MAKRKCCHCQIRRLNRTIIKNSATSAKKNFHDVNDSIDDSSDDSDDDKFDTEMFHGDAPRLVMTSDD